MLSSTRAPRHVPRWSDHWLLAYRMRGSGAHHVCRAARALGSLLQDSTSQAREVLRFRSQAGFVHRPCGSHAGRRSLSRTSDVDLHRWPIGVRWGAVARPCFTIVTRSAPSHQNTRYRGCRGDPREEDGVYDREPHPPSTRRRWPGATASETASARSSRAPIGRGRAIRRPRRSRRRRAQADLNDESPAATGLAGDGASRARTGDLLGAMDNIFVVLSCSKPRICRHLSRPCNRRDVYIHCRFEAISSGSGTRRLRVPNGPRPAMQTSERGRSMACS
jgi:hypothetical protein